MTPIPRVPPSFAVLGSFIEQAQPGSIRYPWRVIAFIIIPKINLSTKPDSHISAFPLGPINSGSAWLQRM